MCKILQNFRSELGRGDVVGLVVERRIRGEGLYHGQHPVELLKVGNVVFAHSVGSHQPLGDVVDRVVEFQQVHRVDLQRFKNLGYLLGYARPGNFDSHCRPPFLGSMIVMLIEPPST